MIKCPKLDCIEIFKEYIDDDGDKEFKLVHCQVKGCHNIYYQNKTGFMCHHCDSTICQYHACQDDGNEEDQELWQCPLCNKINDLED